MRDREHSRTSELLIDQLLDGLLGDYIDVGRRFIEHDELAAAQDRPDDADQLALADRQVLALLLNFEVKAQTLTHGIFGGCLSLVTAL